MVSSVISERSCCSRKIWIAPTLTDKQYLNILLPEHQHNAAIEEHKCAKWDNHCEKAQEIGKPFPAWNLASTEATERVLAASVEKNHHVLEWVDWLSWIMIVCRNDHGSAETNGNGQWEDQRKQKPSGPLFEASKGPMGSYQVSVAISNYIFQFQLTCDWGYLSKLATMRQKTEESLKIWPNKYSHLTCCSQSK